MRVARLDAGGNILTGPGNGYVSKAPVDITITLNFINGAELQQLQGCGTLNAYFHAPDVVKDINVAGTLTDLDAELLEVLTGETSLITEAGQTAGMKFPSVGACGPAVQNGVCVEFFTKRWGACGPPSDGLLYWDWVLPRAYLHNTAFGLKNDIMPIPVTGYAIGNERVGLGPWGDFPVQISQALGMVFARPDMPAAQCGYVSVPSSGSPS